MLKRNVAKTASARKTAEQQFLLIIAAFAVIVLAAIVIARLGNSQERNKGSNDYRVERVSTADELRQGLSGRKSVEQGYAMQFIFGYDGSHCMWMKDMIFSIDIVWLDESNKVVHLKESVKPDTYPENFCSPLPARTVLEMKAGEVRRRGLDIGTQIAL